ncbi:MAG: hypothetical protein RLZZ558_742 [Planctomycetota bacterium]|jgi:4-hydroxybenzoate polyprenyltransferase
MARAPAIPASPNRLGAWLRLMRASNAPTVVSGALLGAGVGAAAAPGGAPPMGLMVWVAAACTAIYLSGMVMNDYFDQAVDRRERPMRPLVCGEISEHAALVMAMLLLAFGVAVLSVASPPTLPWTLLLVSAVMAYNLLHQSPLAGPPLMAVCRGLVPTLAAIACAPGQRPDWDLVGYFALPLALYTLAVSIVARHEVEDGPADPVGSGLRASIGVGLAAVSLVMPFGAVAMGALGSPARGLLLAYVSILLVAMAALLRGLLLLVQPGRGAAGVMTWIAGMSLMDAAGLLLLGQSWLAAVAVGCAVLARLLQRRIAGS